MQAPVATGVPFAVPARFLATGVAALTLATTASALRPRLLLGAYAAPDTLALVHVLTLGFGAMVLVGALHQLMPVLLVAPLHSARMGTVAYGLLLPGVVGVVAGFASGVRVLPLAAGGGLVLAGLGVFGVNLWRTARAAPRLDVPSRTLLASVAYLGATALLGVAIAVGRVVPELAVVLGHVTPLHLALGLFGTFFLAVAAAGHKLLAMFVLAHGVSPVRLRTLAWLVHGAILTLAASSFLDLPTGRLPAVLLAAAVALFAVDVGVILRRRVRKSVDIALWPYLAAPIALGWSVALGFAGEVPAAVAAILLGFLPLTIGGMMIKIASFLTWQHRYAPHVGRGPVPMLRDMQIDGLGWTAAVGLALGAALLPWAVAASSLALATVGAWASALGAWSLAVHVVWLAAGRHVRRQAPVPAARGVTGGNG